MGVLGPMISTIWRDTEATKSIEGARGYLKKYVKAAIEQKSQIEKSTAQSYVFLHELLQQTEDETMLLDQIVSLLVAGRDTTAVLLSLTFFVMAKRQDIWSKLREEVLTLDGKKPSFEDLKSIKYLSWVLNESKNIPVSCNN